MIVLLFSFVLLLQLVNSGQQLFLYVNVIPVWPLQINFLVHHSSKTEHPLETTTIEISAKLGNEEEKKSIELMIDDQIMNHNFLISDFDAQDVS